ncbi:MAG: sigma-70 family RNA polymerase sigma factor [Nitrospirae bacterium]|nr:MAG: sigma-70 family RNA polymerase sigma factor [Nitrospirota bacterium]
MTGAERVLSDPETWPDRHGDYLFRCALLRVRDKTLAEEIVQETFLAALKARGRFAGQSSERSWLIGIMKHKIVDQFRKTVRETPTEDLDRAGFDQDQAGDFDEQGHWKLDGRAPRAWPDSPSLELERKQFWDVLTHCLGELPPKMARVFSLREVDELSADEVCEALKISQANLWVLLHRARRHLRRCLELHHFTDAPA